MRRMRVPLIVVISAYSVAVLGFTLVPGMDDQGEPWRMSIFQAFYVVSYTGSTIGFGEIPYEFTNAQRMWTLASIYMTVFSWLYAVGSIISLLQDPAFRQSLENLRLQGRIQGLCEPFYLVCGYGDNGRLLVRALADRGRRVVVIDSDRAHIDELSVKDMGAHVPAFCMDAGIPANLLTAGLKHEWCVGVLAVTNDDHTNLRVAIAARLLHPRVKVCCRARQPETMANMYSFGTDAVINAGEDFADRLALALRAPDSHRVYDWLSSLPGRRLPDRVRPPEGTWILCGFGEEGKPVYRGLREAGVEVVVVDPAPGENQCPPRSIRGKGTEAVTLQEAGIHEASAVVAATGNDADNLSIIMTARQLQKDLYLVAVENRLENKALFEAAAPELVVQSSYIVTTRLLSLLASPLLGEFLERARQQGNDWNRQLAERLRQACHDYTPESWSVQISEASCPAVMLALAEGEPISLGCVCRDPRNREHELDCMPLMLRRGERVELLPDGETLLEYGDQLLFCGHADALGMLRYNLQHLNTLRYVHTGIQRPDGLIWRKLARH